MQINSRSKSDRNRMVPKWGVFGPGYLFINIMASILQSQFSSGRSLEVTLRLLYIVEFPENLAPEIHVPLYLMGNHGVDVSDVNLQRGKQKKK